jgi:phosphocarrier protein
MIVKDFKINYDLGLHARIAAKFVEITNKYTASIHIRSGESLIDGKSIMGILSLGIKQGDSITVEVDGVDEEGLIADLEGLFG